MFDSNVFFLLFFFIRSHVCDKMRGRAVLPSQRSPWQRLGVHSVYRWSRSPPRCPPAARTGRRTWPSRRASGGGKIWNVTWPSYETTLQIWQRRNNNKEPPHPKKVPLTFWLCWCSIHVTCWCGGVMWTRYKRLNTRFSFCGKNLSFIG